MLFRSQWTGTGLDGGRLLSEDSLRRLRRPVTVDVMADESVALDWFVHTHDAALGRDLASALAAGMFRPYWTDDVIGVSVGGAVKNVLAIAAGIVEGRGLGHNAAAALITRGLAEMRRLGLALGAKPETFLGLAGVGDLVLTCTDNQSRNRRLGLALGQGISKTEASLAIAESVEGVYAAECVWQIARTHAIEMPIAECVYRILNEGVPPLSAVEILLSRQTGFE